MTTINANGKTYNASTFSDLIEILEEGPGIEAAQFAEIELQQELEDRMDELIGYVDEEIIGLDKRTANNIRKLINEMKLILS